MWLICRYLEIWKCQIAIRMHVCMHWQLTSEGTESSCWWRFASLLSVDQLHLWVQLSALQSAGQKRFNILLLMFVQVSTQLEDDLCLQPLLDVKTPCHQHVLRCTPAQSCLHVHTHTHTHRSHMYLRTCLNAGGEINITRQMKTLISEGSWREDCGRVDADSRTEPASGLHGWVKHMHDAVLQIFKKTCILSPFNSNGTCMILSVA